MSSDHPARFEDASCGDPKSLEEQDQSLRIRHGVAEPQFIPSIDHPLLRARKLPQRSEAVARRSLATESQIQLEESDTHPNKLARIEQASDALAKPLFVCAITERPFLIIDADLDHIDNLISGLRARGIRAHVHCRLSTGRRV